MERVQALNIDVLTGAVNPMPKVKDAGDDQLWVRFESASHFDDVATREQGRPIFRMAEYIQIVVPGDASTIIHRPVRETDKERWPTQYAAFLNGKEQQVGYPLSEWSALTRSQIDELQYFKIQTVEQLASVSDATCQKFTGLVTLKEKAKIYLETLRGEEPALKLQAELATRDEQLAAMQAQMAQMQETIQELSRQKGKKGRHEDAEAA